MNAACSTASLALLMALASGQAMASAAPPLQLGVAAPDARAAAAIPARLSPEARPRAATFRAAPRELVATQEIRQRALQSVLAGQDLETSMEQAPRDGRLNLKFQRRGNPFKDLQRGYREMCDRASAKLWDEPNGKRVRFDVAGRVGVGVEIPLGRARR